MQNAAIRLLGPRRRRASMAQARDIIFGQLRQVIASMRIEEINRDRDAVPADDPEVARARAAEDRPRADQRQHHRHHGRVGLHRGDRPQGRGDGDPAGRDRRRRAGEEGRGRRRRAPTASATSRSPTPRRSARSARRRPSASRLVRVAELDKDEKVGEQTRRPSSARRRSRTPSARSASGRRGRTRRRSRARTTRQGRSSPSTNADLAGAAGRGLPARRDEPARGGGRGAGGAVRGAGASPRRRRRRRSRRRRRAELGRAREGAEGAA